MRMQIAHSGKTGKDTSITFDTDEKIFCYGREKHDVFIYAEQTKDVTGVINDLKNIGFEEVDRGQFIERCGIAPKAFEAFYPMIEKIGTEAVLIVERLMMDVAEKYPDWAEYYEMTPESFRKPGGNFITAIEDNVKEYLDEVIHAHMKAEFVLDKNYYSGRPEGSLYLDEDGVQHLNIHNLATELTEECIESVLADNAMQVPDEDRIEGNEEEESWLYGMGFARVVDSLEEELSECLTPIAKEVHDLSMDERDEPER